MPGSFDPAWVLWLKPEILLSVVGLLLLAVALLLPSEARAAVAIVALVGIVLAGILVAGYLPSVPLPGPKIQHGEATGAFFDGAGRPAILGDGFAVVLKLILLAGGGLTVLLAARFLAVEQVAAGEFYALLTFALVGMMLLVSGGDFATLYIGLETSALASYALVGITKRSLRSNEAALKYFLLGALASAILLFGISLVFGATGSFHLDGIAAFLSAQSTHSPLLQVGAILILVGLGFKIAAVPFHMWVPDAYEGAPTPIAAFLSTAAKAAAFAMLLRVFLRGFYPLAAEWTPLLALLAAASMIVGNVTAIRQDNVKRMLAYSSVAHAGYVLMGLVAIASATDEANVRRHGLTAVVLYLLVYTFTNMGAFGLVALLRRGEIGGDRIEDFRGLSRTNPAAAAAMVVFLLSLAGIPCTAGFIGKWWLFGAALRADFAWLAVLAVLNSALSLYYYARIAVAMYMMPAEAATRVPVPPSLATALVISAAFTLAVGIYPQPIIRLAEIALLTPGPR